MANFPTHAGTGAFVGFAYGMVAHTVWEMPLPTAVLAGGLCIVASMLPDVDSDHAVILREVLAFVAAIVPMLLLDRFHEMQLPQETIVAIAGLAYVIIRFGGGELVRRTTVQRGMWHSIPAAALASMLIYFICACPDLKPRLVKTFAVSVGYVWHLILDEVWAVERIGGRLRTKRSFGTALKFFSNRPAANILVYGALLGMIALTVRKPTMEPVIGVGSQGQGQSHAPSSGAYDSQALPSYPTPSYPSTFPQATHPRQQMTPTPRGPIYQPPR